MNGILIIDKPRGWTSHDVVGKLRGVLKTRRIGHGGTLDPMATGVLPVFVGRATRAVQFCESTDKEYTALLRLGVVTDTQDTTGSVLEERAVNIHRADLENALSRFTGELMQIPPMYSAVKIGGKKLYELARRGVEVERAARPITVSALELIGECGQGDYSLRIVCSKGTYVRTLCHDIGQTLCCGGVMAGLRRERVGAFTIGSAMTIDEVISAAQHGAAEQLLRPVDSLFSEHSELFISGGDVKICRNGGEFSVSGVCDGLYRVYEQGGEFLCLGSCELGKVRTVKSFFEV